MKKSTRVWLAALTAGVLEIVVSPFIHNNVLHALVTGAVVFVSVVGIESIGRKR